MPCVLVLAGFVFPRIIMLVLLLFTNFFAIAYQTWYWPLLGFLFMPYTTLGYLIARVWGGDLAGGWIVLVIVAVILDLGLHRDSSRKVRRGGRARWVTPDR